MPPTKHEPLYGLTPLSRMVCDYSRNTSAYVSDSCFDWPLSLLPFSLTVPERLRRLYPRQQRRSSCEPRLNGPSGHQAAGNHPGEEGVWEECDVRGAM